MQGRIITSRSLFWPHWYACLVEAFFRTAYRVCAVVKDRSGERGVGFTIRQDFGKVFGLSRSARGDHRNPCRSRDGAGKCAVEAGLDAVGVHRSEQDFTGSEGFAACCPFDRIDAFVVASAAGIDVPFAGSMPSRVDRQDDSLRAELLAELGDECGPADGGGIDRDLVRARHENLPGVGGGADASSDGKRDEDLARGAGDDARHDGAAIAGGRNVKKDELVGALLVVAIGELDGVSGVAEVDEVDAFDDASGGDVEAGDDSTRQHGSSTKLRTIARPSGPDFSGWHCTPKTLPDSRIAV